MIRAIGPMAIGVILSLVGVASAAPIVTLFPGATDFRIASVADVEIAGIAYDATFHHDITYEELAANVTNPITFSTPPTAGVAANAVVDAINAAMIDDQLLVDSTSYFYVPFEVTAGRGGIDRINFIATFKAGSSSGPLRYSFAVQDAQAENQNTVNGGWVTFAPEGTTGPPTAAVPEPGSIISFGIGAMLLGVFGYLRQRKQHALLVS